MNISNKNFFHTPYSQQKNHFIEKHQITCIRYISHDNVKLKKLHTYTHKWCHFATFTDSLNHLHLLAQLKNESVFVAQ